MCFQMLICIWRGIAINENMITVQVRYMTSTPRKPIGLSMKWKQTGEAPLALFSLPPSMQKKALAAYNFLHIPTARFRAALTPSLLQLLCGMSK